mgnify:FL=1
MLAGIFAGPRHHLMEALLPSTLDLMSPRLVHPLAQFAPTAPAGLGDDVTLPRMLTSAELRQLAAQWRDTCDADDTARAEKVAAVLEWLADRREPQPRTRLQALGDTVSGWLGL